MCACVQVKGALERALMAARFRREFVDVYFYFDVLSMQSSNEVILPARLRPSRLQPVGRDAPGSSFPGFST